MNVFIIPSWYPTIEHQNWCNWILPHIEIVKQFATVTVLYVDSESGINKGVEERAGHFFYASVKKYAFGRFTRTLFYYPVFVMKYLQMLDCMYCEAVRKYGQPNIIHAHASMPAGLGAAYLQRKYGVPALVTEHYSGTFSDNRYFWRLSLLYKLMNKNINGLFAVSPGFSLGLNNIGLKTAGVTPNPINTDLFCLTNLTNRKIGKIEFVTVGTGQRKGTDILLSAFALLSNNGNWHLTIIGNGNMEIPQSIGKKITYIEKCIDQSALCHLYSTSDVYVMSSRIETANVSMLEAMSCGCYVVCNVIQSSETLLDESICSFYNGTPESLSKQLARIIVGDQKFNRQQQRDYVVKKYSQITLAKQLEQLYFSMSLF